MQTSGLGGAAPQTGRQAHPSLTQEAMGRCTAAQLHNRQGSQDCTAQVHDSASNAVSCAAATHYLLKLTGCASNTHSSAASHLCMQTSPSSSDEASRYSRSAASSTSSVPGCPVSTEDALAQRWQLVGARSRALACAAALVSMLDGSGVAAPGRVV